MTKPLLALGALALALALAPLPAVRADEPAKAAAKAAAIQWIDGWAAGHAAAKEQGKLMFVYVTRKSPP